MTSSELSRIRRQMHRRIREVVAERRLEREGGPGHEDAAEQGKGGVDDRVKQGEESLIGG